MVAFNFIVHSGKITHWCARSFVKHKAKVTEKKQNEELEKEKADREKIRQELRAELNLTGSAEVASSAEQDKKNAA